MISERSTCTSFVGDALFPLRAPESLKGAIGNKWTKRQQDGLCESVSGISAASAQAQDLSRPKVFDLEKVGLEAVQSQFPNASNGRVGLAIGDGVNQPFMTRRSQVIRRIMGLPFFRSPTCSSVVDDMRDRGAMLEEATQWRTRTESDVARVLDGREGLERTPHRHRQPL